MAVGRRAILVSLGTFFAVPLMARDHLCLPNESVVFSCTVNKKIASLCADELNGTVASLAYRSRTGATVERTYAAGAERKEQFFANSSPADPGASVRQIWFERGGYRYLLTQCVGGTCPYDAGLAVIRQQRLLRLERCERLRSGPSASFAGGLVEFGADADSTRSLTPLIQVEDVDNLVTELYPVKVPLR